MKTILVLTMETDSHADQVMALLKTRDVPHIRFDYAEFPKNTKITSRFGDGVKNRKLLQRGSEKIDLNEIGTVWLRRPQQVEVHQINRDQFVRRYVETEADAALRAFFESLSCPWLPSPRSNVVHWERQRETMLRVASEVGFSIPPTLITDDKSEFFDFYRTHEGQIIGKKYLHGEIYYQNQMGETEVVWTPTKKVSRLDIGFAHLVGNCPMFFQAYVPKAIELRITIVKETIFAAEIDSQYSHHTKDDWRMYDHFRTPYRVHQLPLEIQQCCLRLMKKLGLKYCTIDMAVTPNGQYIFFEINPNGQWQWIEGLTGMPISLAVTDLLIEMVKNFESAQ